MHVFERLHSTLVQGLTRGRVVFPSVIFIEGLSPQRECANMGIRWRHIDKTGKCTTYCYLCSDSSIQRHAWRNANVCRPIIINLSRSVSSYTWPYAHTHMLVISLMLVIMDGKFHQKQRALPRTGLTHLRQSHVCRVVIEWFYDPATIHQGCLHQTFRSLKKTQAKCDFSCVGQISVQESTLAKSQMGVKSAEVARWLGAVT